MENKSDKKAIIIPLNVNSSSFSERYHLYKGNVMNVYDKWAQPDLIISDGAYGIKGFDGDASNTSALTEWYRPHIEKWSANAKPSTCLWFWNTEIGWATVHPILDELGWEYVQTIIWDKGIAHIAGNVNGDTIRQFPVASEISVLYRKKVMLPDEHDQLIPVKKWLRAEWERTKLPLYKANEACGVKNAATRKYLTKDDLWYWPPGEAVEKMAIYANQYGIPSNKPYFTLDGKTCINAESWDKMRSPWHHRNGLTNIWTRGPLADSERYKGGGLKSAPRARKPSDKTATHLNQKPLEFMERQIYAASNINDVIWEPFGGMATASVAAIRLHRIPYVAEINTKFQPYAEARLENTVLELNKEVEAL